MSFIFEWSRQMYAKCRLHTSKYICIAKIPNYFEYVVMFENTNLLVKLVFISTTYNCFRSAIVKHPEFKAMCVLNFQIKRINIYVHAY